MCNTRRFREVCSHDIKIFALACNLHDCARYPYQLRVREEAGLKAALVTPGRGVADLWASAVERNAEARGLSGQP